MNKLLKKILLLASVLMLALSLARGGGQGAHHPDAGPCVYRNRHHLRPAGRYSNYLRTVTGRCLHNAVEY